jgi:3-hexulose-6-phosphate synthase
MAFSADKTITDTLEVAKQHRKRIMIDLLGISDRNRILELVKLGVDLVSLHFGKDMQQDAEMHTDLFNLLEGIPNLEVAVAGGITLESFPAILEKKPNTIIVGSAITKAEQSKFVAEKMKGMISENEINH